MASTKTNQHEAIELTDAQLEAIVGGKGCRGGDGIIKSIYRLIRDLVRRNPPSDSD